VKLLVEVKSADEYIELAKPFQPDVEMLSRDISEYRVVVDVGIGHGRYLDRCVGARYEGYELVCYDEYYRRLAHGTIS